MSTQYEESSTTHTSTTTIGCNKHNLCSTGPTACTACTGALKVFEIVMVLTGFLISTMFHNWGPYGAEFVQFVTVSAFVLTGLLFVFHVIGIIHKLSGPWTLIELIFCALYSLMLLIAGIVATARAIYHVSFCVFLACLLYVLDTFLSFRAYQGVRSSSSSAATTTTTTTTTQQSYETCAQY